jgi:flagellar basal body-associated protein FliL
MAAKEPKEDEKPKDGAEETPAAPKAKSSSIVPLLLSSVIVAVVLGGVGFALAYFVVPMRMAAATDAAAVAPAATAPATAAAPATPVPSDEKTTRSAAEVQAEGGKIVTKFTIEEITVNIADTKGNRFVRAGVYFDADPAVLEELEANRARMMDTVGQVLSTKTLDDLTSPNIRGDLRQELLGIINPTLKSGHVDNVYFTDLLVQ